MTTGERIKAARKAAGMTQAELSQAANVAINSLRRYEANIRNPKIETLQNIAEALKVPISALTEMSEVSVFVNAFDDGVSPEDIARVMGINTDVVIDILRNGAPDEIQDVQTIAASLAFDMDFQYTKSISKDITDILFLMNRNGQRKALDYVKDISVNPEYQRDK